MALGGRIRPHGMYVPFCADYLIDNYLRERFFVDILTSLDMFASIAENLIGFTFNVRPPPHP